MIANLNIGVGNDPFPGGKHGCGKCGRQEPGKRYRWKWEGIYRRCPICWEAIWQSGYGDNAKLGCTKRKTSEPDDTVIAST
jgi:hypothetical protein